MNKISIPYGKQLIESDDVESVVNVLKSDYLTTGPEVAKFEFALANFVSAKYAVAVNSGTSALDLSVAALDLPAGSEIITTPFTFVASANCALYNNCKPVFADIDLKTYNLGPESIKKSITKKTKAIIYVDYAGQPCSIDEIKEIAESRDLFLIEDACHSLGAEYKGKRIGSFADMTVFSFHPVKHITTGEGGAITTENEELYNKLKILRNHGIDKTPSERKGYSYDMIFLGRNYRLSDINCALGLSQLRKLVGFLEKRKRLADIYYKDLSGISKITLPHVEKHIKHAWHIYPILINDFDRDLFFEKMRDKGIGVNVHYLPVYGFSYYKKFGYSRLPNTEFVSSREISLPMYASLSKDEITYVINSVKEILGV